MAARQFWRKHVGLAFVVLYILLPTAFLFQNCGKGFETPAGSSGPIDYGTPDITFLTSASLISTSTFTVQFDVTGVPPSGITLTCQVGTSLEQICDSKSITLTGLVDGDYILKVSALQGATVLVTATKTFRKDGTPPTIAVSGTPASLTNQTMATFVFVVSDNLSGVNLIECSQDNAAYNACVSPLSLTGLSEAAHNLRIRAQDLAGNNSSIYSYDWTVDLSAPTVTLTQSPPAITNLTSATFGFGGTNIVSYECLLDNGAYASCTSPKSYSSLANGSHTFKVRGTNASGTKSADAVYTWTVDTAPPPAPTLASDVTAVTNISGVAFTFSAANTVTYECQLDGAAYAACVSPKNYPSLADGAHTFRVRGTSAAGNVSAPSSYSWSIDTVAPVTPTLTSPVESLTYLTTAQFTFSSSDAGSGLKELQCSLNAQAYATCTSPRNLSSLAIGAHSFQVRAVDQAGNLSTVSTISWEVVPNVTVIAAPLLAADSSSACTISNSGVYCWGTGWINADVNVPGGSLYALLMPGLETGAQSVTTSFFDCAIVNGRNLCWGNNDFGTLGDGTLNASPTIPVQVVGLTSGVTSNAAGWIHSCAVQNGAVKCWGQGNYGQLGTGLTTTSYVPVQVAGLGENVQMVESGGYYTCVIMKGTVWCWGLKFGPTDVFDVQLTPIRIPGLRGIVDIAVNIRGACAVNSTGNVFCWGFNLKSFLGNSVPVGDLVSNPIQISGLSNVQSISSKDGTTCVVATGAVQCWGIILKGQSTNDVVESAQNTFTSSPLPISGLESGVSEVAVGVSSACARVGSQVKCWGDNSQGQLGNNSKVDSETPVVVQGL